MNLQLVLTVEDVYLLVPARLVPSRLATYSENGKEDLFVKYSGMNV